jgi:CDP-glucose 4,6-dehydratase
MAINTSFWKNKRVLVTGHEGFLGSNLTKTLIDVGSKVTGVDIVIHRSHQILKDYRKRFISIKADIADLKKVSRIIKDSHPQVIFHLAAEAIVGKANRHPVRTFKSNIEGTWNILESSVGRNDIEAIVVASSDKAYGSHEKLPYTEQATLKGEHPYDVSKSCADLICRNYFVSFGLPVSVTRCGNIYGPGDYNFSRLIPDAVCSLLKGQQFVIRSDGKFTRDYIFVQDIVDAYMLLAEKLKSLKLSGEAFNFSCEEPTSVLELYKKLASFFKPSQSLKPKILNQAKLEIKHQYLSAAKARKILGWKPRYTLKDGLKETIGWYKESL